MSVVASLLELLPFFNGLVYGDDLKQLILEPHLDVCEGVGQVITEAVEIFPQRHVLGVLEQQLLLWKLFFAGQVFRVAEIGVDFW